MEEERLSTLDVSKNYSTDNSLDSRIWAGLSADIVELIRAFLPPSALFRFRCVCKRWNLLRSDPVFTKLYKEIAPPTTPSILVITHDGGNKRVRASYLESFCKWFHLPLDFLPEVACVPLAEAGGLLCMGSLRVGNGLWVCNPLMRSWRRLPDCRLRELCRETEKPLVNMTVTAKAAYRVVVVGDPSLTKNLCTLVKIYHSDRGLWTHHVDELPIRSYLPLTSVIRDGVLYWCTMTPDGLHAYNLEQGTWSHRMVRFPRLFTPFGDAFLFRVGGRIGLMGLKLGGQSFSIGMWTLEDEEGQASPGARWVEMPRKSLPVLRRPCLIQGFVQKNVVCIASLESQTWIHCNLMKGTSCSGVPIPDHGEDRRVHYNWCTYEPRLDISA